MRNPFARKTDRPTLRERLGNARIAFASAMRPRRAGDPIKIDPSDPDERLHGFVAEFYRLRALYDAAYAKTKAATGTAAFDALEEESDAALDAATEVAFEVYETHAQTPAGLVAKAEVLRIDRPDHFNPNSPMGSDPATKAFAEFAETVRRGGITMSYDPDPILSVIEVMEWCELSHRERFASPLPAAGSEEARAAFREACKENSSLSAKATQGYPVLKRGPHQWWTTDCLKRALQAREIDHAEYARLYPYAAERELRIEAASVATNIPALFALAFPEECHGPGVAETHPSAEDAELIRIGQEFKKAEAAEVVVLAHQSKASVGEPERGTDAWNDWKETLKAAEDASCDLLDELADLSNRAANITAMTPAGLRVKAHILKHYEDINISLENGLQASIARDILAMGGTLPPSGGRRSAEPTTDHDAPAHDDAELIALGSKLDDLHAKWRDAEAALVEPKRHHDAVLLATRQKEGGVTIADIRAAEAVGGYLTAHDAAEKALEATTDIVDAILVLPVHTIAGAAVKARALVVACWAGGNFEECGTLGEDEDWEDRALRSVILSICAAAGVDWKGKPLAEGGSPASQPTSDTGKKPLPALAELSTTELLIWGELLRYLSEHATTKLNAPFARGHLGYTPSGLLIDAEIFRFDQMYNAVAEEARRRVPKNKYEAGHRFSMLFGHAVDAGDWTEERALVAEMAAAQVAEARTITVVGQASA